jgi:PAS domain S-box-containing protein
VSRNAFQYKLEELKCQFSWLQQASAGDPGEMMGSLSGVLAEMQRSLEELQGLVAGIPGNESAGSDRATGNNGERPRNVEFERKPPFHAVAGRAQVLIRIMDTEGRCQWANRAWLEATGRSMQQLLGEGWLENMHPEDRVRCGSICHEAVDVGGFYRVEYRLKRETGEYDWVLEIGAPRFTPDGTVAGFLGTAIEITEYKQAETRLALQSAVARVLSEAEMLEEAAAPILQGLCESLGWDVGELWSVDTKERVPHCAQLWASPSVDVSTLLVGLRTRIFPPSAGLPWQSGNPVWISDIAADATLAREPEAQRVGLHGMIRLPISVHGEVRAILRIFSREIRRKDDALMNFMTSVGVQIGQFLERQQSNEKIRESESRKAAILEASLDAVITIDRRGQVVEFNSAAETIFGYRREDAVGRELSHLIVPPRLREQALVSLARYWATGKTVLVGKRFDTFAMKSDGSEFPIEVAIAPIESTDQAFLTVFVCDASARKKAEHEVGLYQERLRSLMADLLLAEEHERRRLAVDLHDGLSQTIALAQIKLSALRRSMNSKLKRSLDEIEELIEQTNRAARSIGFELSPPVLHDLGLPPALQWLVENIHARYGIEVVLDDDGQPKPADEKTRIILFRSIRELLINAAKHARARRVHVRLQREDDHLNAMVEDDGIGMDSSVASVKGSGLLSIQERLRHVGGSMRIESTAGRGTKIRLRAPLRNGKPTKERVDA